MRIFVAKHVSLSIDSRLFSGVERFSPFPKLINMPTHFVHNAWEQNYAVRIIYYVRTYYLLRTYVLFITYVRISYYVRTYYLLRTYVLFITYVRIIITYVRIKFRFFAMSENVPNGSSYSSIRFSRTVKYRSLVPIVSFIVSIK